ncbi:MAG: UDP-3-O-(3-hydroxymyristoyl)glucosamine N-acyltransferase [Deltaproteobacteria bacterium]|nr:UDP-3-O-(3-hydroxymyristoyl)glucosamine N-acyltransferase [Deltaproteobacteria bacterium]
MITIKELAEKLNAAYFGDGSIILTGIKPLSLADENDLSFYAPTTKRNQKEILDQVMKSKAGAILVPKHQPELKNSQIITAKPLEAIIGLAGIFYQKPIPRPGIDITAIIAPSAKIAKNATIGAYSVIGENVEIGEETIIFPHVVIYDGAKIGKQCRIHSFACIREHVVLGEDCLIQNGVIVGGDGFGYIPDPQIGHRRIPHIGNVVLEDRVDLGANATVDRATLGETRIRSGTKIDNLVMVGHNVQIGEASILCSQVGVSGSTTIGKNVVLAGQVGIADHVHIGDKVRAQARTGIIADVPASRDIAGHPSVAVQQWKRQTVAISKLAELTARIRKLEHKFGK